MDFYTNATGPWTAGPPDGDAFLPFSVLLNSNSSLVADVQRQNASWYLPPDTPPEVVAGFAAQLDLTKTVFRNGTRAAFELLNDDYGGFSVSIMQPLSRGLVQVKSKDLCSTITDRFIAYLCRSLSDARD